MARPDTEVVFDPATYVGGVPYDALARLRRDRPVAWADEIPVLAFAGEPSYLRSNFQRGVKRLPITWAA